MPSLSPVMDLNAVLADLRELEARPGADLLAGCQEIWAQIARPGGLRTTHDAVTILGKPTWSRGVGRRQGVDPGLWYERDRRPLWFAPNAGRIPANSPEDGGAKTSSCDVWIDAKADVFVGSYTVLRVKGRQIETLVAISSGTEMRMTPGPDFGLQIPGGIFLHPVPRQSGMHWTGSEGGAGAELPRTIKAAIKHALEYGIGPAVWASGAYGL